MGAQLALVENGRIQPIAVAGAFLLTKNGRTREEYRRDLRHYLTWCSEYGLDPFNQKRAQMDAFKNWLLDHYGNGSVNRHLSVVSGMFRYAMAELEDVVFRNPAALVDRQPVSTISQATGLTFEEAEQLLRGAEAYNPRCSALVHVLLLTGMRVSELVNASIEDLGEERGHKVLRITRKGGHTQTIVIPPSAWAALEKYIGERTSGPLIVTSTGRRITRQGVWDTIKRLCRRAGVRTIRTHDLRHTAITLALESGKSLESVQDMAGHADPRTTRRYDRARNNLDNSPSYALDEQLRAVAARREAEAVLDEAVEVLVDEALREVLAAAELVAA
ncbi:tyrosine-type recombinase/integrase [Streptomyces sp. NPDC007971]|uniref:tyrosine-type recombinase/integrase n=1 Tax=Streptomyces sp. NPDC007971 TaxID=3364799 RepID=UPI0036EA91FA